jgi:hypothetical protein
VWGDKRGEDLDLLFLPQSFIKADSAGRPNFTMHEIDAHDLEDLSLIIDRLLKNKVKIVSFSDIVK